MVEATFEQDSAMSIPMNIWAMEKAIRELPWYAVIKRWKMEEELAVMKATGARIGFYKALKDLEEIGIINKSINNK